MRKNKFEKTNFFLGFFSPSNLDFFEKEIFLCFHINSSHLYETISPVELIFNTKQEIFYSKVTARIAHPQKSADPWKSSEDQKKSSKALNIPMIEMYKSEEHKLNPCNGDYCYEFHGKVVF